MVRVQMLQGWRLFHRQVLLCGELFLLSLAFVDSEVLIEVETFGCDSDSYAFPVLCAEPRAQGSP